MGGRHNASLRFWRDAELPFLEARRVVRACGVNYAKHTHDGFSLGAVTGGRSHYWHRLADVPVGSGAVVAMNPGEVHACTPDHRPWSYYMLHIDPDWLARLQRQTGVSDRSGFHPLMMRVSWQPRLYGELVGLCETLFDDQPSQAAKEQHAQRFFSEWLQNIPLAVPAEEEREAALSRACVFMERHAQEAMSLDDVAAHAGLSPSHLIRCFKRQYAITPHGFLTDCRIRRAKRELLLGYPLAEVALRCRFADQAHFQRTFKRLTAATPRQYVLSAGQSPGRWPQAAPPAGD